MNTDIRLSTDFYDHPKTVKLIRRLGSADPLIRLWIYAAKFRPEGRFDGMGVEDIEIGARWNGEPGELVNVLISLGWLDEVDGVLCLHDWEDHNGYVSSSEDRSAKGRFSRMAKTHPELYANLKSQGVSGVSAEEFRRLTTVQRPFNDSLTKCLSPSPSPSTISICREVVPSKKTAEESFEKNRLRLMSMFPHADYEIEKEKFLAHYAGKNLGADPYVKILSWFQRIPKPPPAPSQQDVPAVGPELAARMRAVAAKYYGDEDGPDAA